MKIWKCDFTYINRRIAWQLNISIYLPCEMLMVTQQISIPYKSKGAYKGLKFKTNEFTILSAFCNAYRFLFIICLSPMRAVLKMFQVLYLCTVLSGFASTTVEGNNLYPTTAPAKRGKVIRNVPPSIHCVKLYVRKSWLYTG